MHGLAGGGLGQGAGLKKSVNCQTYDVAIIEHLPPPSSWPQLAAPEPQVTAYDTASLLKPYVLSDGRTRSLHFSPSELQSRMDLAKPWQLEVDYTLTMMGFLLLQPAPKRIAMVGLGGGSLAKFCYQQLPDCHFTVVEINPHVIALREDFCIPADNHRFEVRQADGADFVASPAEPLDVLLIDGFDQHGQPAALCTQAFYDDCFARLAPNGLLVVNLHYDSPSYSVWVARILRSFAGNLVELPAAEKSNCIVFASRGAALTARHLKLQTALARLDRAAQLQLRPEFTRLHWHMRDLNARDLNAQDLDARNLDAPKIGI